MVNGLGHAPTSLLSDPGTNGRRNGGFDNAVIVISPGPLTSTA